MTCHQRMTSPFQYNPGNDPSVVTYLQGLKGGDVPGTYLLVGANNSPGPTPTGLVYRGALDDVSKDGVSGSGDWLVVSVPDGFGAAGTSIYGPANLGADLVHLVGAYTRHLGDQEPTADNPAIVGFTYTGAADGSTTTGWRSVQGITQLGTAGTYTFVHSVDGGLAVGNTDNATVDGVTKYLTLTSTAFIVELESGRQIPIAYPEKSPLVTHTAYGIWANGDGTYTIAGGSGEVLSQKSGTLSVGRAYLIDYDRVSGAFRNYTTFAYDNRNDSNLISHFEGIYRTDEGEYILPATSVALNEQGDLSIASVVKVRRDDLGHFSATALWEDLKVTRSSDGASSVLSTANSLYGGVTVGFANYPDGNGGITPLDFVVQPA
jgi:hypothetical protein